MSSIISNNQFNQQCVEKNLDIYIPRVSESFTEDHVKSVFADMGIGLVTYVDFVATKDPVTKKHRFFSAFLRLSQWHPDNYWYNKIFVDQQNKIEITKFEFWIILPAKTSISRSKVNTHQLAAYTDELYVRVEAVEKSVTENMTVSSTHFQNLIAKSEAQAAQIDQLLKIVAEQSTQLSRINAYLFDEEQTKPRALTIEDDKLEEILSVATQEPLPEKKTPVYFEDECFFLKPLTITTDAKKKKLDIESGSISFDLNDVLGPVGSFFGMTKEQVVKGLEKEWAGSQRAKSSSHFCGNA
jgi:hypothetical protein